MYLLLSPRSLTKKITAVFTALILAASLLVGLVTAVTSSETAVTSPAVPAAAPANTPLIRLNQPTQSAETGRPVNVAIVPYTVSPARSVTSYDWGDVDGDGDLDLAVGAYRQGNRVYLNQNGDFSQLAWTDTMTDNNSAAIAWGDVDGDGDLDLAVGLSNAPNRLYLNENGRLQTTPAWTDNLNDPTTDLAWGDMDGDGALDLVVANRGTANKIFANTGAGLLAETAVWQDPGRYDLTTSLDLADVDQDGDLDVVFGNYVNDRPFDPTGLIPAEDYYARLYRNRLQETGRLQLDRDWVGGNAVSDVAWGDLNGDQYPELALVDFWNWGNDGVYKNTAGNLAVSSEWRPRSINEYYQIRLGYSVAWGDVDNDGDLDLAMGFSTDTRERIYLNNGGSLADTPAWESSSFERALHIGWADVDRDGDLDLTVIYAGQVNVYANHAQSLSPQDSLLENSQRPSTLAWGDVDNDGDLDLAVGTGYGFELRGGVNTIYRQDGSGLSLIELSGRSDQTTSLAWGDVNGDGWLDLAVGNYLAANLVYLNQNGAISADSPVIDLGGREATTAIAWADVNGDGNLDLAVGSNNSANRLYLNTGSGITATQFITFGAQSATLSLAWGDVDGDGDLDLAVGNAGQPNQLYFNNQGRLSDEHVQTFGGAENSAGLAWGDVNGDGNLDVVVGNAGSANRLYLNAGGRLAEQPAWTSGDLDDTRSVALGDVDGDGDLDLAAANASGEQGAAPQPNKLYLNENGRLQTITDNPWTTLSDAPSYAAAWNDVDGDGDLDLTFASRFGLQFYANDSRQVYPARAAATIELAPDASPLTLPDGTQNTILAPVGFYGAAGIRENGRITFAYTLTHPTNQPVPAVRGFYSPDGGGRWLTAVPVSGTQTTNLSTTPGQNRHTFTWDVFGSGLFGQSDNVVFRLEAVETIPGEQAAAPGTFRYTNQRVGLYQRPYIAATTLPFRVRGNQIRVFQDVAQEENAAAGAFVYRLPAGSFANGVPLSDESGLPYRTDDRGFLQGRTHLEPGDQLVALWPAPFSDYHFTFTNRATLYYMSAQPIADGLDIEPISALAGAQPLVVSSTSPLLLFDLDVSLEWDARQDTLFLLELEQSFKRASELLFDVSNGRVALGQVRIHQAKENWLASDIVILANSSIRPSASMGGLVFWPVGDVINGQPVSAAYVPGQIRMGTVWDPFRQNTSDLGEDWKRALAHELSHFLLFLPDNYLGIDRRTGGLTTIDCPGSFMTNTYDDSYSEFLTRQAWNGRPPCRDDSLAAHTTNRSDWETITHFYPPLANANTMEGDGPHLLPLNVTQVTFVEPAQSKSPTLPVRVFDVRGPDNAFIRLPQAQAYLFQTQGTAVITDDAVIALGATFGGGDRVKVRGATPAIPAGSEPRAGDRLCLIDVTGEQVFLGCEEITPASASIRVTSAPGWRPNINVQGVTSRTLFVTATNAIPITGPLNVQVFPAYGSPDFPDQPVIAPTATLMPVDEARTVFTGVVTLANPSFEGFVRLWTGNDGASLEALSQYFLSLPFGPNERGTSGPNERGTSGPNERGTSGPNERGTSGPNERGTSGPNERGTSGPNARGYFANYRALGAPVQSSDAQAIVYNVAGYFEDSGVGSLQALVTAPNLDSWLVPVGQAYRFSSESDFNGRRSIAFNYLQREIPEGYEHALTLYFSADEGASWEKLATQTDDFENLAVAEMKSTDGIYVLVATVEMPPLQPGWNLFAYPLPVTRTITAALASISGTYSVVYKPEPGEYNLFTSPDQTAAVPENQEPTASNVDEFQFGNVYWIKIEGNRTVTPYLAPPRRQADGTLR